MESQQKLESMCRLMESFIESLKDHKVEEKWTAFKKQHFQERPKCKFMIHESKNKTRPCSFCAVEGKEGYCTRHYNILAKGEKQERKRCKFMVVEKKRAPNGTQKTHPCRCYAVENGYCNIHLAFLARQGAELEDSEPEEDCEDGDEDSEDSDESESEESEEYDSTDEDD